MCIRLPIFEELSKEQDAVYNLNPLNKNLVVGPPGTGKSIVALHLASRLTRDSTMLVKGRSQVKLVMFSTLLKIWTNSAVGESELEFDSSNVDSFHHWFNNWYQFAVGQNIPKIQGNNQVSTEQSDSLKTEFQDYDWQQIAQRISETEEDLLPIHIVDLIIDEGQDLPSDFYIATNSMTRSLTVFADDNQSLRERHTQTENIREYCSIENENKFVLKKNYRNSLEVAKVAARFYAGLDTGIPEMPDRIGGFSPSLHQFNKREEEWAHITRYLKNNPQKQIGVFLPNYYLVDELHNYVRRNTKSSVQKYRNVFGEVQDVDPCKPGLLLTYLDNAKGLEFDTVFVPSLDKWTQSVDNSSKMRLYVLASRARNDLTFSWSGDGEPSILSIFPHDLLPLQRH